MTQRPAARASSSSSLSPSATTKTTALSFKLSQPFRCFTIFRVVWVFCRDCCCCCGGGGGGGSHFSRYPRRCCRRRRRVLGAATTINNNMGATTSQNTKDSSSTNRVYSIQYDSKNHLALIFQWYGSVWKTTLPYCLANFFLAVFLYYLKAVHHVDLGISDKGHDLMTLFVSFLGITRVTMSLSTYNDCRGHLSQLCRSARELVQQLVLYTKADDSTLAQKWRHDMAYNVAILLRLSMAVIDYPSQGIPCWQVPELRGKTKEYLLKTIAISRSTTFISGPGEAEMNMRVPIHMSELIRSELFQLSRPLPGDGNAIDPRLCKLEAWQFATLFGSVDTFMSAYYRIRIFLTTPFPFPLIQMARTFMFIYVFTLPFALLNLTDTKNDDDDSDMVAWVVYSCIIFLVTYGFVGLEYAAISFDDPFGDDDNDFDNLGMMYTALEDIHVTICNTDGEEWMNKLMTRLSIHNITPHHDEGNNGHGASSSEQSSLLQVNNHNNKNHLI
jgi:predicted membrane chloride channel (bestrophin family)